jgi:hypothetical protein
MRRTILAMLLFLAAALPAPAIAQGAVSDADRSAIVSVIRQQLDAFQRDQAIEAFSYASPTIQGIFGTPENFMEMVRTGYGAVYRPREVQFGDILPSAGGPTQRVLFVGPDGVPVEALYFMQLQPDGQWRINGVQVLRLDDRTA